MAPIDIHEQTLLWLQGNDASFEAIFYYYQPRLHRYICQYIKDTQRADDVVMEILTRAWQRRESIHTAGTFGHYLFTAARNRLINEGRRKIERLLSLDTLDERPEGESWDPFIHKELEHIYHTSVSALPEKRRVIFLKHRNDNLTYKEIAEELNISTKTVENQVAAALKFLRHAMSQYLSSMFW